MHLSVGSINTEGGSQQYINVFFLTTKSWPLWEAKYFRKQKRRKGGLDIVVTSHYKKLHFVLSFYWDTFLIQSFVNWSSCNIKMYLYLTQRNTKKILYFKASSGSLLGEMLFKLKHFKKHHMGNTARKWKLRITNFQISMPFKVG